MRFRRLVGVGGALAVTGAMLAFVPTPATAAPAGRADSGLAQKAEKQGTVHIDLDRRTLSFSPTVCPGVQGISAGLGMGSAELRRETSDAALGVAEQEWAMRHKRCAETAAAKRAILDALGLDKNSAELWSEIEVRLGIGNVVYIKAAKSVQQRAWTLKAVDYKIAFSRDASRVTCTATAIADIHDMAT